MSGLAGLPLLMRAPCPHCEQMSIRGSSAAVAPTWLQFGQTIRVSMCHTPLKPPESGLPLAPADLENKCTVTAESSRACTHEIANRDSSLHNIRFGP
jgi:hypothetical protein